MVYTILDNDIPVCEKFVFMAFHVGPYPFYFKNCQHLLWNYSSIDSYCKIKISQMTLLTFVNKFSFLMEHIYFIGCIFAKTKQTDINVILNENLSLCKKYFFGGG